jgi:hypothetical protein
VSVSQPFAATASQLANGAVHAPIAQAPPTHEGVAFGGEQRAPHAPQFSGSVRVSTQLPPQRAGVIGVQPLVQAREAPPSAITIEQVGVAPEQAFPHAPQETDRERSASQPFAAALSQSPKPRAQ